MKRMPLLIAVISGVAAVGVVVSYGVGYRHGVDRGIKEGTALVTQVSMGQKTSALQLIRGGYTNQGQAYLDHTIDLDVIATDGGRHLLPDDSKARQNALYHLQIVARYRGEFRRLPYTPVMGNPLLPRRVDEILSGIPNIPK